MTNNSFPKRLLTWSTSLLLVALVISAPVMLFTGCSNNPTAPVTESTSFWDQPYSAPDMAAFGGGVVGGLVYEVELDASVVIPADSGGVVEFEANGYDASFSVPPDAIVYDTTITVEAKVENHRSGTMLILDFGPDGLQFKESATLEVDARSFDWDGSSKVAMYWLNPLTGRWVLQEVVDVDSAGNVRFGIDHFSMYGIGGKR